MEGYRLVGGQPVKITPFDTTDKEAGTHFAPEGCAFNPIIAGSGGNPNYVETISGTLANPWGSVDYSGLISDIASGIVTAKMVAIAPGSGNTLSFSLDILDGSLRGSGAFYVYRGSDDVTLNEAFAARWYADGTLRYAVITQSGVDADITAYASLATTTLTIIYHPLSEDNT